LRYTPRMSPREFFFENFAGDLEYHPRRAVLYLILAVAAAAFWFFSPAETKFTTTPLVFTLGSQSQKPIPMVILVCALP
jgi:hypothetical protein